MERRSSLASDAEFGAGANSYTFAATENSPIVVDTSRDLVDANDDLTSLREAITLANDTIGADTIVFSDTVRSDLFYVDDESGGFSITDTLRIDGGASDQSRLNIEYSSTPIDGPSKNPSLFGSDDSDFVIEDLEIFNSRLGASIVSTGSGDASVERVTITGSNGTGGLVVGSEGGMRVVDSEVFSEDQAAVFLGEYASIRIEDSQLVTRNSFDSANTIEGSLYNTIEIEGSTIANRGTFSDTAIDMPYTGSLAITNSTIDVNSLLGTPIASGIALGEDVEATLNQVTIVGAGPTDGTEPTFGMKIDDGATVSLSNSIIAGDHDQAVAGDLAVDINNIKGDVAVDVLFETGELADNGGPTPTIALRDDPSNPAIGGADPDTTLAVDQRGLQRDSAPDIGAFEAGGAEPGTDSFPQLVEKQTVPIDEINGADPARFVIGEDGDASITYLNEYAGYQSVLGVYLLDENQQIGEARIVFDRIEDAETSPVAGVSESARPGGGPLNSGDTVMLSDLFSAEELAAHDSFGLFLIADGYAKNPEGLFDSGRFEFVDGIGPASLSTTQPELFHISGHGTWVMVIGNIVHSADATPETPLENSLNPGGQGRIVSGIDGDNYIIGIEDKGFPDGGNSSASKGDGDFNDLIIAIDAPGASSPLAAMEQIIV
ncbi:MAG: CSLREA domain-containing protein [Geminicoccaceae bacterium]